MTLASFLYIARHRTLHAVALAILILAVLPFHAPAQISRTLSYQGMLADSLGNPKPDGTYSFTFRLYQVSAGGSALWTEAKTLSVKRGLFQTVLGDQVVLSAGVVFDRPYWLGIQVAADPELSPRALLTPVGYSQRATVADTAKYALSVPLQAASDSARVAGKIALPYVGSLTTGTTAFSLTSTGNAIYGEASTGTGVWGVTTWISGAGVIGDNSQGEAVVGRSSGGNGVGAVVGRNDNSGYGVRGFNTKDGIGVLGQVGISGGTGVAARFENVNASSPRDALDVVTNGLGVVGRFQSNNIANPSNALEVEMRGLAAAGRFENFNASNPAATVQAATNGTGPTAKFTNSNAANTSSTLEVFTNGANPAGRFENTNAANPKNTLEVVTNGTGHAALFTAGSGSTSNSNAALHVENFKSAGEGIVARKSVAANTDPVALLLEDPSSTGNFLNGSFMNSFGTVTGKFHITSAGTYVAGSDFAESFTAVGGLDQYEPGDVVVLASSSPCAVEKTSTPYDTRVAGVYSTRPGILGSDKDGVTRVDLNDMPVAVIGIVPTKVSAENGAILPGDLLTCSSMPGYAMKASPIMINGMAIYPTGTIIGKALDALPSAQGVIKVLVNLK